MRRHGSGTFTEVARLGLLEELVLVCGHHVLGVPLRGRHGHNIIIVIVIIINFNIGIIITVIVII